MVQTKKPAVREAILEAAFGLFGERGYAATTIAMIAGRAGVSSANVYVYFPSKFDVVVTLYDPWFRAQVTALRGTVEAQDSPRARLTALLHGLWYDIPRAENGFANCFMEAISTLAPGDRYESGLLRWAETQVGLMLRLALPETHGPAATLVARIALMAFDGFAIGRKLRPDAPCDDAAIDQMVALLLAPVAAHAA